MLDVQSKSVNFVTIPDASCFPNVEVNYVPIHQQGYGRMHSSSSCVGLCTSRLASCLAIIVHCQTTSRTTLSHSPNFLKIPIEFSPIFDWVLNGEINANIVVVIFRGALYNDITSQEWGHEGFVQDFRRFSSTFSTGGNIELVDYPKICLNGSILVDKSAKISIIQSNHQGYVDLCNPNLFNIHG
jgi:hypothetical protein